jgi:hypothetical protein
MAGTSSIAISKGNGRFGDAPILSGVF